MSTTRTATPTARRHQPPGARYLGRHAPDASLDVTLVLRRRNPLGTMLPPSSRATRHADFEARYGADPDDVDRLRSFGRRHGLQELASEPGRRVLHLRGTVRSLQQAFGVSVDRWGSKSMETNKPLSDIMA